MKIATHSRIAIALGALALSCAPADVSDPLADACDQYAFAFCSRTAECSQTAISIHFGTIDVCTANYREQCWLDGNLPSTGATASTRTACVQALPSWSCPDFLAKENPPPECQTSPGDLPLGANCAIQQQCQSTFCDRVPGQACGTCQPAPGVGDPCPDATCPQGSTCAGSPPTCQAFAQSGEPCGNGTACVAGLNCVGSSSTTMGSCEQAVQTKDDPCAFDGAGCDLTFDLACNAATGTCQNAKLSPADGPCGIVEDQTASCVRGLCVKGDCVAYPAVGEPCVLVSPSCITPAHCIITSSDGTEGICQLAGALACE